MVWCSVPTQMNASVILSMKYKNYKYYSADTTDKVILYYFDNNYNSQSGYLKISAGVVYKNSGVNHSQPYIEVHNDTIRNGFIECPTLWYGTGSFSSDTLIMGFGVQPVTGSAYSMKCKYKKL